NHQPFGDARHSTHPSPLGFEAGLIPRWAFFIPNFPSVSWQASLASSVSHPQRSKFGTSSGGGLAHDLAQVVSEPIFDVPRLVEAARHQRFDPILGGGPRERSDARIPPGAELDVRRQAGV